MDRQRSAESRARGKKLADVRASASALAGQHATGGRLLSSQPPPELDEPADSECQSPFDYSDIVTSTAHKRLRGPRGGIIFFRKGKNLRKRSGSLSQVAESDQYDFEDRINFVVFPSMQGGPHNNHIAALVIALKQAATPEYKAYIQQVKKKAQALASALLGRKCILVIGGNWHRQSLDAMGPKNFWLDREEL